MKRLLIIIFTLSLFAPASFACDGSPLILDVNGDGVRTTSTFMPVDFDINGNGTVESIAWTDPDSEEALLWLDRNGNGFVDNGLELFGDATHLTNGSRASNGFQALAEWDTRALGGNGDKVITAADRVWSALRLWIDRNHDGASDTGEVYALRSLGIVSLRLDYTISSEVDGNGNYHVYKGFYTRRLKMPDRSTAEVTLGMEDVFLHIAD